MKHLTTPTRSFIYLVLFTLCIAYAALSLANSRGPFVSSFTPHGNHTTKPMPEPIMSTAGWSTYESKEYPVSFRYPADWKVKTNTTIPDYFTIAVTSPKNETITIYVSRQDFFALQGFKTESYNLGPYSGVSWQDTVIAVKAGNNFYTFDGSQNAKSLPEFRALMSTVELRS